MLMQSSFNMCVHWEALYGSNGEKGIRRKIASVWTIGACGFVKTDVQDQEEIIANAEKVGDCNF